MTEPERPEPPALETDDRFPSGPWTGFFLMKRRPGRHWMELRLTFRNGRMQGEGRDAIGAFLIRGTYELDGGNCWWAKRYVGKHDVAYKGFNEGKGIWGVWEIPPSDTGGFHIWPEGMADPTGGRLKEAIDAPAPEPPTPPPVLEPQPVGEVAGEEALPAGAG